MKIRKLFKDWIDYMFYRLNKAYLRWDGEEGCTSHVGVAGSIMLLITTFVFMILDLIGEIGNIPRGQRILAKIPEPVILLFLIVTYYILDRVITPTHGVEQFNEFAKRWGNEPKKQKIFRGICVVLFIIMPFLIMMIYLGFTGKVFGINFLGHYD